MVQEANHSLSNRRDAREQEQMFAQTAGIAIEMTKSLLRFQSDLIGTWANGIQVLAKLFTAQTETFVQYSQDQLQQQSGRQYGQQQ